MNPRVRNLFHELIDLPAEQQEKILSDESGDPHVVAEVRSLLRFDVANTPASLSWGPYQAAGVLGVGGMGTVYLAERIDGEIQQKVAIKLLRTDIQRPGWRARFLKERRVLASLNHAAIAHLIDAGHTQDGRPYLVMEYVDGVPIDEYAQRIDIRDRLALFLRVCDAVSHAHHRLVIHRDLKPSNILVDSSGQPKLLDFGIARLLDDTADRTQTVERLLTPNYASPEQIRGEAESTATDVYSLGAVLQKILTGTPPRDPEATIAGLPDDLQCILRMALRAEPDERYGSVEALATDIRAFLAWQPVQARGGDVWYRGRKFLRRYWVPVAAAVLLVSTLSVGLYAVNRERRIAQHRFDQVRQLSNQVLALDDVVKGLPGSTKARNGIVAIAKNYLDGLMTESQFDNDLALDAANGWLSVAAVQGVPVSPNLGQPDQALESLGKANGLVARVLKTSPANHKALLLSAGINEDRMILASEAKQRPATAEFARQAVDNVEALFAAGSLTDAEKKQGLRTLQNVSLAYKNLHRYDLAIRYGRQVADVTRTLKGAAAGTAGALSIVADALRYSGDLDGALKTITEARSVVENYTFPNDTLRVSAMHSILWRNGMILGGDGQVSLMRPDEAIAAFQQAYDLIEDAALKDPDDANVRLLFIQAGRELGALLAPQNPERALTIFDHALQRVGESKTTAKLQRGQAQLLAGSSYALRRLQRTAEAQQRIDRAFAVLREAKAYPLDKIHADDEAATVIRALGDQLIDTGQLQKAREVYQDLLDRYTAAQLDPENDITDAAALSRVYAPLTRIDRQQKDFDRAKVTGGSWRSLWQKWNTKLPNNEFIKRQLAEASAS